MTKKEIILVRVGIALLLFIALLALLNGPYFFKQLMFKLGLTHVEQTVPHQNNSGEVEKGEPNKLQIPSLNITAPVQYVNETDENVFQVALRDGVVHYPGTAELGQVGNAYIFGHSSDMAFVPGSFKTVFALLPSIANGAEIVVSGKDGTIYRYQVYDQFVAQNTDTFLLEQNTDGKKILTLQTSYPVGTALRRYIVKAELKE
jgi:LPXTG-site transpeptidase (sortase) family protein